MIPACWYCTRPFILILAVAVQAPVGAGRSVMLLAVLVVW
jgi:hypothetical protein